MSGGSSLLLLDAIKSRDHGLEVRGHVLVKLGEGINDRTHRLQDKSDSAKEGRCEIPPVESGRE